ncbi:MAG: ribosomal protein S18-alanine N-acetyltransferase [Chloroflexi bacterium]|nr:ribosomal protein S18-alanine N-acetyltransferase [Chloroflexota bacterium]
MIDLSGLPYVIEPMRVEDVDAIMVIEHEAFTEPWPASAYRHEIAKNEMAHYYLVRERPGKDGLPRPTVIAYGGIWLMVDDAHISTIATRREWRGCGVGELLLAAIIAESRAMGAERMTLEVRVSNTVAQNLYRKYGFNVEGRRKRYYSDNKEDALIMTTPRITSEAYQVMFEGLVGRLRERLAAGG